MKRCSRCEHWEDVSKKAGEAGCAYPGAMSKGECRALPPSTVGGVIYTQSGYWCGGFELRTPYWECCTCGAACRVVIEEDCPNEDAHNPDTCLFSDWNAIWELQE